MSSCASCGVVPIARRNRVLCTSYAGRSRACDNLKLRSIRKQNAHSNSSLLVVTFLAMSTFEPNCTFPSSAVVNYVSSCSIRGTLDILWSCLFTLFICTWTAQHLNIPRQQIENSKSLWGSLLIFTKRSWSKTKWMIIAFVLPEFLVGRAVQDWMMARKSSQDERMKAFAALDGTMWTIEHGFYADMGGFIVTVNNKVRERRLTMPS